MTGLAWRTGRVLELISGKKSPITRESVQNTHKVHTYQSDRLERTLNSKGITWAYEPIDQAISDTAPFLIEALGPAKSV
jgi:hypothetical protein